MSDPIRPDALLRQARLLAGFDAPRGRPSPTNHRRAVSSAYYALFHELITCCVNEVFQVPISESERHQAARWIDHGDIKRVCRWVLAVDAEGGVQSGRPRSMADRGVWEFFTVEAAGGRTPAVPADLAFVADAFNGLQDARHRADYDSSASFPKSTTRTHVLTAERAVDRLRSSVEDPYFCRFFVFVIGSAGRLK